MERVALKDVSLEVRNGEFIGLVGHTGSGKSTLIQHLDGLLRATSGKIFYNGEDIYGENYSMRELRGKVGLVFQYPEHQLFEADVFTDVCFGPKNLKLSKEEIARRGDEFMKLMQIDEFADRLPDRLSGSPTEQLLIASGGGTASRVPAPIPPRQNLSAPEPCICACWETPGISVRYTAKPRSATAAEEWSRKILPVLCA